MGRPLPGYVVALLDPISGEPAQEGEIALDLSQRPLGLMTGYRDSAERSASDAGGYYHTGDVAARDDEGYITYIGRTDDVFKTSDYRISPFELESVLIEHEAVAEAAVGAVAGPHAPRCAEGLRQRSSQGTSRRARPPWTSCASRASTWRRTSGYGGSSSPSCRRRSRARSAGSSCALRSRSACPAARHRQSAHGRVLGGGLPGAAPLTSVGHVEPPAVIPRLLDFVDHCHRQIGGRDVRLAPSSVRRTSLLTRYCPVTCWWMPSAERGGRADIEPVKRLGDSERLEQQ